MLFEAIFDNIQKDYEQLRERNKRLIEILELSDEEVEAIEKKAQKENLFDLLG